MRSKLLLLTCFILSPLLSAEPLFKIHDGKAWQEFDSSGWEKLPRTAVTAKARDGKDRTYSGVPLADILKLIGAPAGETLRGPELGRFLLVTAADGYQVVFSLAELDASFRKQNIILADQVDGQPLSEFEGKRMIVSGDDLRHSRWIRQITGASRWSGRSHRNPESPARQPSRRAVLRRYAVSSASPTLLLLTGLLR